MSHKSIKNTSLDVVFVELRRMGINEIHEKDIVEWSGQALEAIGCINRYEEAVCFVRVENHQATMPVGSHSIIQIAKNHCFRKDELVSAVTPNDIVGQILIPNPDRFEDSDCVDCGRHNPHFVQEGQIDTTAFDLNTYVPTPIDCFGEPIDEYSLAYYRPFFDLQYEYSPWTNSPIYHNCFSPVRLAEHSFFNSLVCKENEFEGLYHHGITDEYNIYGGDTLRFSFKEGQIALSYTRSPIDPETGWPQIPDHISYTSACVYYNIYKLMERQFYAGRDGAEKRMLAAEKQWVWFCNQAGNKSLMLEGIDEYQNFLDQRSYVLPRVNRYQGFFGKLGTPENRKFNNPDFKNSRVALFRGM